MVANVFPDLCPTGKSVSLYTCPFWLDATCGFEGIVNTIPQEVDAEEKN